MGGCNSTALIDLGIWLFYPQYQYGIRGKSIDHNHLHIEGYTKITSEEFLQSLIPNYLIFN